MIIIAKPTVYTISIYCYDINYGLTTIVVLSLRSICLVALTTIVKLMKTIYCIQICKHLYLNINVVLLLTPSAPFRNLCIGVIFPCFIDSLFAFLLLYILEYFGFFPHASEHKDKFCTCTYESLFSVWVSVSPLHCVHYTSYIFSSCLTLTQSDGQICTLHCFTWDVFCMLWVQISFCSDLGK